jgi:hypothetical protein
MSKILPAEHNEMNRNSRGGPTAVGEREQEWPAVSPLG